MTRHPPRPPTDHPPPPAPPEDVRRVACVGAGVIGGGWVAHFLARGYDVTAWDPAPDAEEKLRRLVAAAWPALEQLGLAEGASPDRLTVAAHPRTRRSPTRSSCRRAPRRSWSSSASCWPGSTPPPRPGVVIASSTSGYPMTDMQTDGRRPRAGCVVGHPFNPPYLIPLVEVVGGELTDPAAVGWASRFYEVAGKSVITMDRELPGFIANRLQEALWREALHMVANGEATVQEIDDSITEGPGLRWAFMGPCLTFALAGGEGGMAHMLDHFGPSLKSPWTRLEAPELDARAA